MAMEALEPWVFRRILTAPLHSSTEKPRPSWRHEHLRGFFGVHMGFTWGSYGVQPNHEQLVCFGIICNDNDNDDNDDDDDNDSKNNNGLIWIITWLL